MWLQFSTDNSSDGIKSTLLVLTLDSQGLDQFIGLKIVPVPFHARPGNMPFET